MQLARRLTLALCLLLLLAAAGPGTAKPGVLFQYCTLQALLDGVYDGDLTYEALSRHGDFGLGTFNALDGEMIALDGKFYQIRSDGAAVPVPDSLKTPFAEVTFFKADRTLNLDKPLDYSRLEAFLKQGLPSLNLAYALRIEGVFSYVKARSVPRQQPPYPPLTVAAAKQSLFEFHDVKGVLVGFWLPQYLAGVNVSGYHLHFITADRKAGGHLLDCRIERGKAQIGRLGEFFLKLPRTAEFYQRDLTGNREKEIGRVEK
jgi:acetolactate decarboxylase